MSRRRPLRTGLALLVALVTLAAAGCGGGDDGAPTATAAQPLSHAALTARADAACAKAGAAVAKVPAATSVDELAAYVTRVSAITTSLHRRLRALTPPAADRDAFTRYVAALDTSNRALGSMKDAADSGDTQGVNEAVAAITGAGVGALAASAGLSDCATAVR